MACYLERTLAATATAKRLHLPAASALGLLLVLFAAPPPSALGLASAGDCVQSHAPDLHAAQTPLRTWEAGSGV
eukprot:5024152-Amphidinium_carterae.1